MKLIEIHKSREDALHPGRQKITSTTEIVEHDHKVWLIVIIIVCKAIKIAKVLHVTMMELIEIQNSQHHGKAIEVDKDSGYCEHFNLVEQKETRNIVSEEC